VKTTIPVRGASWVARFTHAASLQELLNDDLVDVVTADSRLSLRCSDNPESELEVEPQSLRIVGSHESEHLLVSLASGALERHLGQTPADPSSSAGEIDERGNHRHVIESMSIGGEGLQGLKADGSMALTFS